jgi:CheY-like chemotaxis protein
MSIKHTILYADDDFADFDVLRAAFEQVRPDIQLIHATDGWAALYYLQTLKLTSLYPGLIVLDLNMEGIGGKETVSILKSNHKYRGIPVVLFTGSKAVADRDFCLGHGLQLVQKPATFDDLKETAHMLATFCDLKVIAGW